MKRKPLSRREKILVMFSTFPERKFSCQDICKKLIKSEKLTGSVAHYLSGSISSILRKMVIDKTLKYASGTAIKGGHLYEWRGSKRLSKQSEIKYTDLKFGFDRHAGFGNFPEDHTP